jgi:hypothetical protein
MKVSNAIAVLIALFVFSACLPDMSGISLSDCMKACNDDAKFCITQSDSKIDSCTDVVCIKEAAKDAEWCMLTMMDCTAICVKEIEDRL